MRPDKNKGAAGRLPGVAERTDLAATLHVLKKDLDRLLAFLDTYERSRHPDRIEALRWLQPTLDRHLRVLTRHRRSAERACAESEQLFPAENGLDHTI